MRYALSNGRAIGCCGGTGTGGGERSRGSLDSGAGEEKKRHKGDVITAPAHDGMVRYGKRNHLADFFVEGKEQDELDRSVIRTFAPNSPTGRTAHIDTGYPSSYPFRGVSLSPYRGRELSAVALAVPIGAYRRRETRKGGVSRKRVAIASSIPMRHNEQNTNQEGATLTF